MSIFLIHLYLPLLHILKVREYSTYTFYKSHKLHWICPNNDRAESVPPFYSQITQVCVVYSLDVSTCLPLYEEEETIECLSAAEEEEEDTSEAAATAAALEEEEEEQWSGEEPEQEPLSELLERAEVIGEVQALLGLQAEVHTQAATAADESPNGRAEEAGGQKSPAEGVSILLTPACFSQPSQNKQSESIVKAF